MRFRSQLAFTVAAAATLGCSGERVAGPSDEASRAAAELERAAADLGLGADPSAALTLQSVATALRGGVRPSQVEISVDGGLPEKWYAFAHEIRFEPRSGAVPADLFTEATFRVLLAWRATDAGPRLIHLAAVGDEGPIGAFFPTDLPTVVGPGFELLSNLMYSEGRNLFWDAVRGRQTSSMTPGQTPCPTPRRPAGAPPAPRCVLAGFTFGFSDVEAEPFSFPFGPGGPRPSVATGTRRLSMAPQQVDGTLVTIDFQTIGFQPLAAAPRP